MAKDYVVVGQLALDARRWKKAKLGPAEGAWPALLGPLDGAGRGTVTDAIARLVLPREGPAFFEIRAEGDQVTLEGLLAEDALRDRGSDLSRVLAAAQAIGGRGRVQLRDPGTGFGAAIAIEDGARRIETFRAHSKPSDDDVAAIRRVLGAPAPPEPSAGSRPDRWTLEVAGTLTRKTKDWLASAARTGKFAWPKALGEIAADAAQGTVADAIEALAHDEPGSFLEVRVTPAAVSFAGRVREGALLDRAGALAALLASAADAGASGVVFVRGPGGARIVVEDGALRFAEASLGKRLAPRDAVLFERLGELTRARAGVVLDARAKARIAARQKAQAKRARSR